MNTVVKTVGTQAEVKFEVTHDPMLFNIVVSRITSSEGLTCPTYGISRDNYRKDDIFIDIHKAALLVERLNRAGDVADCHIDDIVEEFMEKFC